MPRLDSVDQGEAHAAVSALVPRIVGLIRSIRNPDTHAVGEWSVGDVAVHLGQAWEALPALALRRMPPPLVDLWDLGGLTRAQVHNAQNRDLGAIAGGIEAAAGQFLAATADASADDRCPWIVQGVEVPLCAFACHLVNEMLVHGDDIARAEGRPWRVDRAHAGLALMGFLLPMINRMDPRTLVNQERAAGFEGSWDVSLRRQGRVVLRLAGGALRVEPPSRQHVHCHLSADPAAFLFVMFARRALWQTVARGRIVAWGQRPWLAPKLRSLLRNP